MTTQRELLASFDTLERELRMVIAERSALITEVDALRAQLAQLREDTEAIAANGLRRLREEEHYRVDVVADLSLRLGIEREGHEATRSQLAQAERDKEEAYLAGQETMRTRAASIIWPSGIGHDCPSRPCVPCALIAAQGAVAAIAPAALGEPTG